MARSQTRLVLLVVLGVTAVSIGGVLYVRGLPPVDEAFSAEATEAMEERRTLLAAFTCEREPNASPGDAPSAVDNSVLLDEDGVLGPCIRASLSSELSEEMTGGDRFWVVPPTDPPEDRDAVAWMVTYPPTYPSGMETPAIRGALESCTALLPILQGTAAHSGTCSPVRVGSDLWSSHVADSLFRIPVAALAKASVVMARAAPDSSTTLHHLLDAVVAFRDLRAGPTTLRMAMMSALAEKIAWVGFQSELIHLRGSVDYEALRGRIERINSKNSNGEEFESPHALLLGEVLFGFELPDPDGYRSVLWLVYQRIDETCPPNTGLGECIAALPTGVEPYEPGFGAAILGPRPFAHDAMEHLTREAMEVYRNYLTRLINVRMLPHVALELLRMAEQRSAGICPENENEGPALPEADGGIVVSPIGGGQFEVQAPRVSANPTFERMAATFVCPSPARGGSVFEAYPFDGTRD